VKVGRAEEILSSDSVYKNFGRFDKLKKVSEELFSENIDFVV